MRRAAYVTPAIMQSIDQDGRDHLAKDFDLLLVDQFRWPILQELRDGAERWNPDQKRLMNLGNWIRLQHPADEPKWRLPTDAFWLFDFYVATKAAQQHPEFFTGGSYGSHNGSGQGKLAAIDQHAYFKLYAAALKLFLPRWKAAGIHGAFLEWGWFSNWIDWLLGRPEESPLDPALLTPALFHFHLLLQLLFSSHGMVLISQRITSAACSSERHRTWFDGCKYESPDAEVNDEEGRWMRADLGGPGWWKQTKGDMTWTLFETQFYPDEPEAARREKLARHIERANEIGAAICWYNTNRRRWPNPADATYHKVLPEIPEGLVL